MLQLLPNWCLTDTQQAFYDCESATAIEMTAKVYAKMNELIDDYNQFVNTVNKKITDYVNSSEKDFELFSTELRQEFQDFIDTIELKIKIQDRHIDNAIAYMKDHLHESVTYIITEMRNNGTLSADVMKAFDDLNTKIAVLQEQVNSFNQLPEGSTTADAELIDIRLDAYGKTHATAGDAVRSQITGVNTTITELKKQMSNQQSAKNELPAVSDGDNGKVLTVVNGSWNKDYLKSIPTVLRTSAVAIGSQGGTIYTFALSDFSSSASIAVGNYIKDGDGLFWKIESYDQSGVITVSSVSDPLLVAHRSNIEPYYYDYFKANILTQSDLVDSGNDLNVGDYIITPLGNLWQVYDNSSSAYKMELLTNYLGESVKDPGLKCSVLEDSVMMGDSSILNNPYVILKNNYDLIPNGFVSFNATYVPYYVHGLKVDNNAIFYMNAPASNSGTYNYIVQNCNGVWSYISIMGNRGLIE